MATLSLTLAITTAIALGTAVPASANSYGHGPGDDIVSSLKAIPGMSVSGEKPSGDPAYRFFELTYRQPADHRHPEKGTFEQRLTLLHKSTDRPMVLFTTGYSLPTTATRAEPTA